MIRRRSWCLFLTVWLATWALTLAAQSPEPPSQGTTTKKPTHTLDQTNSSFIKGFIAAISVVVVSELGDKTFFIAAIMAMKHSRVVVFCGAISALIFMTVLSVLFGSIATIIPRVYTYYISAALFAIFGIKMLRDGWKMDKNEGQEELEEVQSELKRREDQEQQKEESSPSARSQTYNNIDEPERSESYTKLANPETSSKVANPETSSEVANPETSSKVANPQSRQSVANPETSQSVANPETSQSVVNPETSQYVASPAETPGPSGIRAEPAPREEKEETLDMLEQGQAETRRRKRNAIIKVLLQAATLTFLAEWGDRSQLATVVLATRENIFGVMVGGSLGHALCTGLAVIGGRMVAQRISVRTVTIIGGIVFLFFAVTALIMGPGE